MQQHRAKNQNAHQPEAVASAASATYAAAAASAESAPPQAPTPERVPAATLPKLAAVTLIHTNPHLRKHDSERRKDTAQMLPQMGTPYPHRPLRCPNLRQQTYDIHTHNPSFSFSKLASQVRRRRPSGLSVPQLIASAPQAASATRARLGSSRAFATRPMRPAVSPCAALRCSISQHPIAKQHNMKLRRTCVEPTTTPVATSACSLAPKRRAKPRSGETTTTAVPWLAGSVAN